MSDTFTRLGSRLAAGRGGWALAAYLVLAFCFLGIRVAAHPERDVVGGLFTDPQIFVWSFAWWPHAILHGLNPFYTHQIWAPDGFNLAWATSVPGLAIAFAPLTLLFGPVLAYNVASIAMPLAIIAERESASSSVASDACTSPVAPLDSERASLLARFISGSSVSGRARSKRRSSY